MTKYAFADLRQLLLDLGFQMKVVPGSVVFEHEPAVAAVGQLRRVGTVAGLRRVDLLAVRGGHDDLAVAVADRGAVRTAGRSPGRRRSERSVGRRAFGR